MPASWGSTTPSCSDPPARNSNSDEYGNLLTLKKQFEDAGLNLAAIEGLIPMDEMKSGGPGRDEQIEQFCHIIRNMGALEIPVLCYSWMVFFTWARTSFTTRGRGGALVSSYEHHLTDAGPRHQRAAHHRGQAVGDLSSISCARSCRSRRRPACG